MVPSLFRDPDRVVVVVGAFFSNDRGVVKGNDDDGRAMSIFWIKSLLSSVEEFLLTPIAFVVRFSSPPNNTNNANTQTRKYYFCVANADFMLNDENSEHFPEILRERRRFYRETDKPQDFWIVPNPTFLDAMPEVKKKIRQPCVAVVTTDEVWNTFVKLRMDRVYKGSVEGTGSELLKSNELIAADAFPPVDKAKWTAPYNKYAAGWWEVFYPGADWTKGYQTAANPLAEKDIERSGA